MSYRNSIQHTYFVNSVLCFSFSWPEVLRVPWVFSYATKLNMSEHKPALGPLWESLFHLLMNVPKGVPQGAPLHPSLGGVKPLPSCWGATSWRGPPTSSWASHAPLPRTGGPHSSLLISFLFFFFRAIYLLFLLMPGAAVLKDADQGWQGWKDGNVVLITLFALVVVIYGDTLQMSSRSLFDFFSLSKFEINIQLGLKVHLL